jgi:hypothetical protein
MAIDYSQLRSLTARELIGALIRDGFFLRAQVGSHQGLNPNGIKFMGKLSVYKGVIDVGLS